LPAYCGSCLVAIPPALQAAAQRSKATGRSDSGHFCLARRLCGRETGNPGAGVEAISEEQVATTLEPFVNPRRIKILKELLKEPLSSSELILRTGLVGGQLYHHLTVLEEAKMIAKDRERYVLTYCGAKLLFLLAMAAYDTWNAIQAMPVDRLPYD
jgi:DNA-binding transcriptional ArsR family regulator